MMGAAHDPVMPWEACCVLYASTDEPVHLLSQFNSVDHQHLISHHIIPHHPPSNETHFASANTLRHHDSTTCHFHRPLCCHLCSIDNGRFERRAKIFSLWSTFEATPTRNGGGVSAKHVWFSCRLIDLNLTMFLSRIVVSYLFVFHHPTESDES